MVPGVASSADLMSDRRKHVRRLTVKELIGVQLGVGNRGIVVDLSEAGMRVQAAARVRLPPSSLLRFEIPGCSTPVTVNCEVAWADEHGKAGLRFTGFSETSLQDLRRWLTITTAPVMVEKREEIRVQTAPRPLGLPLPKPQVVTAPAYPGTLPASASALPIPVPASYVQSALTPAANNSPNGDTFEARLHAIAQNLMTLTAADGAAVALRSGDQIVCRASVGTAPPVGVILQQDSGLAGECVRTAMPVSCTDTNEDTRVNREACQRLNLRSTILMPVVRRGTVHGVLEVFSSRAGIFDRGDVMAMARVSDIVAGLLDKLDTSPEKKEPAAAHASAKPTATTAGQGPSPRPTVEAALRLPRPRNGILVCDACGHPNPESARDCEACDVPLRVPELEALLGTTHKRSTYLVIALMVLGPLSCFYAGHETGVLMRSARPAIEKPQPVKADALKPELAKK